MANSAARANANFLQVERTTKRFRRGRRSRRRCRFRSREARFFALLGSSGSGKFTAAADAGRFRDAQTPAVSAWKAWKFRSCGLRASDQHDVPVLCAVSASDVTENIAFGLKRHGWARERLTEQVDKMLALVQLKPYARRQSRTALGRPAATGCAGAQPRARAQAVLLTSRWRR